jgi:hypothetical protein
MSLDSYLEGLTKEAEQKKVEQVYLKTASVDELKALLGMNKKAAKKKESAINLGTLSGAMEAGEGRRFAGGALGTVGGLAGGALGGAGGFGAGAAASRLLGGRAKWLMPAGLLAGSAYGQWRGGKALGRVAQDPQKTAALEVGDAAGRILAKMAAIGQPKLTPEELREAYQAAAEREDIPGRAKRWGRTGGALGAGVGAGVGGGLGHFVTKALGAKSGLPGMVAGGLGLGAAGGLLGTRIGRAEGAEEAAADRLLSQMRARRNMMRGAAAGYMAGRQAGGSPFQAGR